MFFPPECGLLFCSSAHSNQGRSVPLLEHFFTFKWEDPPLGTGFEPSLDSSLRMSANYNN